MSLYWDDALAELRWPVSALTPKEVVVFIDCDRKLFPGSTLNGLPKAKIFYLGELFQNRFSYRGGKDRFPILPVFPQA